jgi:putative endonuclease
MDRERRGGWVYIMTDRYRGTLYVGVTANLPQRIFQHRDGRGSDLWKFALIEQANPEWSDLYDLLA